MREFNKYIWTVALVATSALLGGATRASATSIVIDDLTQGPQLVVVTAPGSNGSTVTGLSPAHVIGGSRQLYLQVDTGTNLDSMVVNTVTNRLNFNIGAGDQGFGTILYNANGASGGLNAHILSTLGTTAANTYFRAFMGFSDLNLGFMVQVSDGLNVATYSTNLGSGTALVTQAFGSFANAAAVDFNSIDWLQVTLSGPQAQDAQISFLDISDTQVPEPASLLLLGTGLAAVASRLRKRA